MRDILIFLIGIVVKTICDIFIRFIYAIIDPNRIIEPKTELSNSQLDEVNLMIRRFDLQNQDKTRNS